ncbi:MAG TPA: hypothetical protein PKE21_17360 [Flavobacteriales bacterium]|nr:hypothetical protein [Flavobacteriales bacterium]HMR29249.1 hypothetical protein [Flavobacteriales bacterium]
MRSRVYLSALLLSPCAGLAQCSVEDFTVTASCAFDGPEATVVLEGGQPPYQLLFTGSNGNWVMRQSEFNGAFVTDMGDFINNVLTPPVDLVVTDADGCTASASASFPQHALCVPEVWFDRACDATTSSLLWTGTFYHAGSGNLTGGLPDPCNSASFQYTISNSTSGTTISTGALTANWTLLPNGFWRFNAPLPHGAYYVLIHPTGNPVGCTNGAVTYCYRSKGAITDPSAEGCGQQFQLRLLLGGALPNPGLTMRDSLRVKGLVPISEPYTALGYTYVGTPAGQTIAPALLTTTGSGAIVDWVVVELRDATSPSTIVHSMPALVRRDGRVMGLNGSTTLRAPLGPELYHVAVRHRTHLGVMTATSHWTNLNPLVAGGALLLDIRSGQTATFGTNAQQPNGANFCLWPGDTNFDGQVKYAGSANDRDPILNAVGGTVPTDLVSNVYSPLDVNLDGTIKYTGTNNDRDIILQSIGGTVPTSTRTQQLP